MTPEHPIDIKAARSLWSAVLMGVLVDLCSQKPGCGDRTTAERWIGAWPSRDFAAVCTLAGLDPVAAHERLRGIIALPVDRRPAALLLLPKAKEGRTRAPRHRPALPGRGPWHPCDLIPDTAAAALRHSGSGARVHMRHVSATVSMEADP